VAYPPCRPSRFVLGLGSPIERLRDEHGVVSVRNVGALEAGLPGDVGRRLRLPWLSFDGVGSPADWSALEQACADWSRRYDPKTPSLCYSDGGTFLRIEDRRREFRVILLEGKTREIYLYCTEIRGLGSVLATFVEKGMTEPEILALLEGLVAERVMFREDRSYLALAPARTGQAAARRIRAMHPAGALGTEPTA